jgi:RNA polymerase sigma factor (sigma-70 family)
MGAIAATDELEVAFNLAYRIAGSETVAADAVEKGLLNATQGLPWLADGDLPFRQRLFVATRNACHDGMPRRQQPSPAETIPAPPESPEEAIASASMRLPVRQREALALRELCRLSYEEIAAIMETSRSSVAQLTSRARINLSDELRGTVLASVVAPSPECERALPLIAMRQDGQLEAGSREEAWLDVHLTTCDRCRLGVEAMREADASYRSWAPIAAAPRLLAAKAAHGSTGSIPDPSSWPAAGAGRSLRRRPLLAAGLATLLLTVGGAAIFLQGDPTAPPLDPTADAAPALKSAAGQPGNGAKAKTKSEAAQKGKKKSKAGTNATQASVDEGASTPAPVVTQVTTESAASEPASAPDRPSGETGVEPPQRTATPRPSRKPKPTTTTAAVPESAPAPAPMPEEPSAVEEPVSEPPWHKDPPGKAVGRPPK